MNCWRFHDLGTGKFFPDHKAGRHARIYRTVWAFWGNQLRRGPSLLTWRKMHPVLRTLAKKYIPVWCVYTHRESKSLSTAKINQSRCFTWWAGFLDRTIWTRRRRRRREKNQFSGSVWGALSALVDSKLCAAFGQAVITKNSQNLEGPGQIGGDGKNRQAFQWTLEVCASVCVFENSWPAFFIYCVFNPLIPKRYFCTSI